MGSHDLEADVAAARKRSEAVDWLNTVVRDLGMRPDASEDELRGRLFDGSVLCSLLNKLRVFPREENRPSDWLQSEHRLAKIKRFILVIEELHLPAFRVSDLEQGSMAAVVVSLLALRDHLRDANLMPKYENQKWRVYEDGRLESIGSPRGDYNLGGASFGFSEEDRRRNLAEVKSQRVFQSPVMPEPSSLSTAHHIGHKFHEVFQLKQGSFCDIPPTKLSEIMKCDNINNAPTQGLLSFSYWILDESIERKNGEIPQRGAFLVKSVMKEIERRISTQAQHIRYISNAVKSREEKYQDRLKILQTLKSGTSEENQVVTTQFQQIKEEKIKSEESKKLLEQDILRLTKEKDDIEHRVKEHKQELEGIKQSNEQECMLLKSMAKGTTTELENRIREAEILLEDSRKRNNELEASSESNFRNWNKKEHIFNKFMGFQLHSVQNLKAASELIKLDVVNAQKEWLQETSNFGLQLKALTDAAENYHKVLLDNRKLFNELQELKGNIRVYCRIRPFLNGQSRKMTTIDFIGENGELTITNPLKQGKDGHRIFKFNKVFGPSATQEDVFADTQPLIRSVLDGYNVCIFAYGQTGSGKTYTMSGPNFASKVNWGVNYRALNDLFQMSQDRKNVYEYEVGVQMVEIYNEQVRDLLANDGSQKRLGIWSSSQPNGLAVPDASMYPVNSTSDVLDLMEVGLTNRAVGATALNERSSRSHSVLTIHVRGRDLKTGATSRGSLHLVDLAGSERVDRSEAIGERLKEAQHINKSLSALGDVIFALSQKNAHVPYRNSKLTQVLQSSLGGQAKTLMFVHMNPDVESFSETLSTLKFAERVSGVELGAARSNKEGKDVRDLMEQVASLKDSIARKDDEIEQLQMLKDTRTQSAITSNEGNISSSFKHSTSSPGMLSMGSSKQARRLSGEAILKNSSKTVSDPENFLDNSDRQSESGSQRSFGDLRSQNEIHGQRHSRDENGQCPADSFTGNGDPDSEERLSDLSDGGLSMGTETDGSMSSSVECNLFPESVKAADAKKVKSLKAPSRVLSKSLSQISVPMPSVRPKLNNSSMHSSGISGPRKAATSHAAAAATTVSSVKSGKPWQ